MAEPRPSPPIDRAAGLSAAACRLLDEAGKALSRADPDSAERSLVGVMAMAPTAAEPYRLLGIANQMRGDHQAATQQLRRALAFRPDDAMTLMNLGSSLYECGAHDEAIAHLRRACELAPGMASAWYNLGKALKMQIRAEEACEALQHALSLDASHTLARISLADAQVSLGRIEDAVHSYRDVLQRHPEHPDAWHALANLKTQPLSSDDTARLQRAFGKTNQPADARISLGFALAKALEDQERYPEAFEILRQANALKRRCVHWDAAAESAYVDAIMTAFDRPMPAPLNATLGHEVTFIASLPRSGSTLTEQILASHPMVEGADEITELPQVLQEESKRRRQRFPQWVPSATAEDWARLGHDYLARTVRWRQQRPRFTDKNMLNWEHVGAVLAMLPGARVIICHRDAVETCFACYRQLFAYGSHFSYDLDEMARYYLDYMRLSRFWLHHYSNNVIEHSYEKLLADPETQVRRLLDHCSLTFDQACLTFYNTPRIVLSTASAAQVRQPLRKNASYSSRYEAQLEALRGKFVQTGKSNQL